LFQDLRPKRARPVLVTSHLQGAKVLVRLQRRQHGSVALLPAQQDVANAAHAPEEPAEERCRHAWGGAPVGWAEDNQQDSNQADDGTDCHVPSLSRGGLGVARARRNTLACEMLIRRVERRPTLIRDEGIGMHSCLAQRFCAAEMALGPIRPSTNGLISISKLLAAEGEQAQCAGTWSDPWT
jgi:hypothetical protein